MLSGIGGPPSTLTTGCATPMLDKTNGLETNDEPQPQSVANKEPPKPVQHRWFDQWLIARGEPPHFAHKNLDLSGVTASITDTIPTAPVVIEPPKKESGIFDSPLVMVLLVIMGISILANIILTVLLAR